MSCVPDPEKIEELLEEVKMILRTPIRGCIIYTSDDDLPDLLTDVIEKLFQNVKYYLNIRDKRILSVTNQLIFLLKRAWSCYFFSNEQKLSFNQLRWDISLLKKNSTNQYHRPMDQVQKPKQENANELRKLEKELLDGLISYMEEWLTRAKNES